MNEVVYSISYVDSGLFALFVVVACVLLGFGFLAWWYRQIDGHLLRDWRSIPWGGKAYLLVSLPLSGCAVWLGVYMLSSTVGYHAGLGVQQVEVPVQVQEVHIDDYYIPDNQGPATVRLVGRPETFEVGGDFNPLALTGTLYCVDDAGCLVDVGEASSEGIVLALWKGNHLGFAHQVVYARATAQ